ncbi:SpoVK/Ycf46/Vps4 family AAA+-type ATPase [Microbacteriaceae bacterium SG_E_30_P1]|uniref:SpoVK/Ycf46/Vps4 family AAA+-type ATPase n=1 Tax=Antiquaquibacter oligotrophicus TaxID=2880260 RepID=A0ABT6KR31_9MICO|nr:ATP-binding protein [Antiquaquibacter oligotrophicus]MDH6182444.1 SpoVK/Ycf46/Vps4 family AAA+-type ATPase [Antiquaquibacter oligotrophicus]UDF14585.1 ATP-binding protein [Antiquaquibacter oligotrophicus]
MSEILDALAAAVKAAPDSASLRVHYGRLLLEAQRASDALEQASAALSLDPANAEALALMRDATRVDAAAIHPAPTASSTDDPPGDDTSINWKQLEEDIGSDLPAPFAEARISADKNSYDALGEVTKESITLDDVGGLDQVKERIRIAFLEPMRNPEIAKAFGKSLRGGLLLYGPPGTGKTFIARAIAGELGANFLSVTLADVLAGVIGESEHNVHKLFVRARGLAPCVVFIDELDALGGKRSQYMNVGWMRNVVNQMLQEMDGIGSDNDGVFLLGATNHPWDVDTALMRPGRFDRTVLVLPPDAPARAAILKHHFSGRPIAGIDIDAIVAKTDGFSGADLAHIVATAAERAMSESIAQGEVRPISMADVKKALTEVKPSIMPWLQSARNVVNFANEDGRYDDLEDYLRSKKLL